MQAFVAQHPAFADYQPVHVSLLGRTVLVRLGRVGRYVSLTAEQVTANFPRYEQEQAPAIVERQQKKRQRWYQRWFHWLFGDV